LGYDANNLTKSFASSSGSNGTYGYDGSDKRVKKVVTSSNGTTTTYYVYDALGRLAAEYSDQTSMSSGTSWIFTDMLGSTRAITSGAGSSGYGSVTECYDYLPFGRILSSSDNGRGSCHQSNPDDQVDSAIPQKFTGKERDAETGLDYFGARYLSSAQGRWTSPDEPFADQHPEDPQSWNLYGYVKNNPLRFIDPFGLWTLPLPKKGQIYTQLWVTPNDGDSYGTLAAQLGLSGFQAWFFEFRMIARHGFPSGKLQSLRLSQEGLWVGWVFSVAERGLIEEAQYIARGGRPLGGPYDPWLHNCQMTAMRIAAPNLMSGINASTPNWQETLDGLLNNQYIFIRTEVPLNTIPSGRTGDIFHWDGAGTKGVHFATFLMYEDNVNGTPIVFSRSGLEGPFQVDSYDNFSSDYGRVDSTYWRD
jgi:RHS repeat-associated protein